jgi:subfamily B ATP-binding cassette protein MsbA
MLLLLFLISGVFSAVQIYLLASVGQQFVNELMIELYSHIQQLSLRFFDKQRVGELLSRLMNDTALLRDSTSGLLISAFSQTFAAVGAVILMFALDWQLTLMVMIVVPVLILIGSKSGGRMRWATNRMQEKVADVAATAEQSLSSARIVKSFARENYESHRFASKAAGLYTAAMLQARITAILEPLISSTTLAALVGILYFGAHRVASGALSPGDLVAFVLYIFLLSGPIAGLIATYVQLQEALAAADRVFSLLDIEPEIVDAPGAVDLKRVYGQVGFRDVRFSYRSGEEVLRGINLRVDPGETVALVGPSGAGKTTLVSLLLRFYDVSSGAVLLDGQDIRNIKLSSLRAHMGLVAQDVLLFSGTIRENIRYGRLSATDAEVETAARSANAHDFILSFPDGYDTLIGERGVKLSGGQRQRISVARTLLSDPSILVLDEATSSLDAESESVVKEAVRRLMGGRTTFVVAHRLSTVANADRIIVLEAGTIEAQGTHQELIRYSNLYRRLYKQYFHSH